MATESTAREKGSFEVKSQGLMSSLIQPQRSLMMPEVVLRIFAIAFTIAAISVTVTAKQTVNILGFDFKARYNSTSAFRFLLGADVVVCAFSVLSLTVVCFQSRSAGSHAVNYFFLILHDMVIMVLAISGCAAATAIGFVSRHGEPDAGWLAVCTMVGKFCNQRLIAVAFSYLAFFCYLGLNVVSAYKLMARARSQDS